MNKSYFAVFDLHAYKEMLALVVVMSILVFIQSANACSPIPGTQPIGIAEKVKASDYVFDGIVKEVNASEVVIQVVQYLKGNSIEEVKMTGFNETSCSDFVTVGQRAIFYADGDPNTSLAAVYDNAFGSISHDFTEITQAIECMATYQDGVLTVPCVAVSDQNQLYSVELSTSEPNNPSIFTLNNPTAKTPIASSDTATKANIESIEILILESFPVQVNVLAKGYFSDGCGKLGSINTVKSENSFVITVMAEHEGEVCTQALVPFEESISLDVLNLKAGTYTVDVNGVTDSFTLAIDNVITH